MANKIVQRLVAAGATPQRAQQFAQQYIKAKTPGVRPTKQSEEDAETAFEEDVALLSEAIWPTAFRPNQLSDEELIQYVTGIYGVDFVNSQIGKLRPKLAPNFNAGLNKWATEAKNLGPIENPTRVTDATLSKLVEQGATLGDLGSYIQTHSSKLDFASPGEGTSEIDVALDIANKLYYENQKYTNANANWAKNYLENNDKYFQENLPHPKLMWGPKTNLNQGVIGITGNPTGKNEFDSLVNNPEFENYAIQKKAPQIEQRRIAGGDALSNIEARRILASPESRKQMAEDVAYEIVWNKYKKINGPTKYTPFTDEIERRQQAKNMRFAG